MATENRLGIYICTGCDIADSLDIEGLEKSAGSFQVCKNNNCFCNPEGLKIINDDIQNENLTGISIAACSPREKTNEFTFDKKLFVDRVNLREQVVWCHTPKDEETQSLGEDSISMSFAKLSHMNPHEPFVEESTKDLLVVGGGVTGLNAALESAKSGYNVILVEKEAVLGGWISKSSKSFPKNPPYNNLEDTGIEDIINEVNSNSNIKVHLSSEVKKIKGQPGQFDVTIANGSASEDVRIGAVVLASGWKPYNASKLSHLGFGNSPDVITNIQIEEMAKAGKIQRPSDGKDVENIVFIQCAGSRDSEHLPYCSGVCCNATLKQVKYLREQNPDANIYVVYKDVRTPGQSELFYLDTQNDERVFFTKGEVVGVSPEGQKISVDVDDTIIGESIKINADMVVLATGIVPSTFVEINDEIVPESEETKEDEPKAEEGKDISGASAEAGAKILNLEYRQGTDLPTLDYGFPDSHYICFPYETRRTGIYAAGCVRAPQDSSSSKMDALGASLKAIQCVESITRGEAVHPRSGDTAIPEFSLQRCTQCKRCTEECPFGTLNEDEKGTPEFNPFRCRRCGICFGACPEKIINFPDYNIQMVSQMIKSIDMPDEFDEKPRILCFVCENDAYPVLDLLGKKRKQYASNIRFIPVRCLGSVSTIWIGDSLSSGFDGILLLGCKHGDDYQCHFIKGSELATTRMENVQDKLKQLVLEPERVRIETVSMNDWDKLDKILNDFSEEISDLDLNPYKGF
ncbi:FAD-dependent oxidoreductase [candidate division KSB1 bacterium]